MTTLRDTLGDPLACFKDGAWFDDSRHPMPLQATTIDVRVLGGFAIVRTARTFHNAEDRSIEATITFPVPVHATMVALAATLGGRTLIGQALPRAAARETYEDAVDAGKTAVLHEEALRGVHILSVAHIPPGEDVVVSLIWAAPVARHEAGAILRIPTTVGDIFGRSPLADSDALIHSSTTQSAVLRVSCDPGTTAFRDGKRVDSAARVVLDRPIDLLFPDWQAGPLRGRAADGRIVTIEIKPTPLEDAPLDAVLLLDQSGSMADLAASGELGHGRDLFVPTKHDVMARGVAEAMATLRPGDSLGLWQFNSRCGPLETLDGLWGPGGGTHIGSALAKVARRESAADIAIVTDGQSHDIEVQALARTGKRFTVVLVGEDSLEAHIGKLAALTGGQLFVVSGIGAASAIIAAVAAMRCRHLPQPAVDGMPVQVRARIAGMDVHARWHRPDADVSRPDDLMAPARPVVGGCFADEEVSSRNPEAARCIAAVAAAMAIPHMEATYAANLAAAHGIVCHLTSLVLVDDAGEMQDGMPAQRKVPMMTPGVLAHIARPASPPDFSEVLASIRHEPLFILREAPDRALREKQDSQIAADKAKRQEALQRKLEALRTRIDWSTAHALRRGDADSMTSDMLEIVGVASGLGAVQALARSVREKPAMVVLALLARLSADADPHAAGLFRAILGQADPALLAAAILETGG